MTGERVLGDTDYPLVCWGNNDQGELGNGSTSDISTVPVETIGQQGNIGGTATGFSVGDGTACAIVDDLSIQIQILSCRCYGKHFQNHYLQV